MSIIILCLLSPTMGTDERILPERDLPGVSFTGSVWLQRIIVSVQRAAEYYKQHPDELAELRREFENGGRSDTLVVRVDGSRPAVRGALARLDADEVPSAKRAARNILRWAVRATLELNEDG